MIGSSNKGFPVLIAALAVTSAMFAGHGEMKPNNCKGPSLCHTRPDIDSNDFVIDVGFLLEQARVTGTMYAYTLGNAVNLTSNVQSLNARRPSFGLDWGVTVGIGRHFEHDDWDLNIGFDWIEATGKDHTGTDFSERLIPIDVQSVNAQNGSNPFLQCETGNVRHKIDYYTFDVMLGRGNFMSGCFAITPHFGIRATWIDNTVTTKFTGGTIGTTHGVGTAQGGLGNGTYYVKRNDDFWGVGPQCGLNGTWGMSEGIGWFCDQKAALLLGYATANDHTWSSVDSVANSIRFKTGSIPVLSPAFKSFLGLQYEKTVYYGCQHIRLRGGWDTAFYFNQFTHSYILNENPSPDIKVHMSDTNNFSLVGLRVDLAWNF